MNLKTKRVLAAVGGGAVVVAAGITAGTAPTVAGLEAQPGSGTASTGQTTTAGAGGGAGETRGPVEVATPSITGAAPLPSEEQGLPG